MQVSKEESIIELIEKLSTNLSKSILDSSLNDNSQLRHDFKIKSRKHIWNLILFNTNQNNKLKVNGLNKMMYFTYELQKISKSENANKIQNLVEKLRILNPENYIEILELLVSLNDDKITERRVQPNNLEASISNFSLHSKLIESKTDIQIDVLKTLNKDECSWLKENKDFSENKNYFKDLNASKNLLFRNFFSINQSECLTKNQAMSRDTLFSAVVSKKMPISNDRFEEIRLDIPDLPNDVNLLNWQIPCSSSYEWIDYHSLMANTKNRSNSNYLDEGFCSSKCSPVSLSSNHGQNTPTRSYQPRDEDVWNKALKLTISDYVDWQMRDENTILVSGSNSNENKLNNRLLLIDSSKEMFDKFYYNYINTVNILNSTLIKNSERIVISESKYITDCFNVLISLPSISFIWNKTQETFYFNDHLHISGISCESLGSYSVEYAEIGTYHRKLINFVQIPDTDANCGTVFRSYCNAIRAYLNHYSEEIISNLNNQAQYTIVSLYAKFKLLMDQIKFLFDICQKQMHLRGLDLIFYLYKLGKRITNNTLNYSLILNLFSKAITPFLIFIEAWIFNGEFADPFNEFLIDVNYASLISKDKNFLQKAFKLKERFRPDNLARNEDDSFLMQNIYEDLFNCGKSLALLKICHPKHAICNLTNYPKLSINFNASYLKQIDLVCSEYKQFIQLNARNELKSRKEIVDETNRARQELLSKMQSEASERFKKYKNEINEQKIIENEKKKELFEKMRSQMEAELKKREEEKLIQKKEDKEYMEKLVNRDFELTAKQKQIEQELKKEITEEYNILMQQAESREQSARERISQARKILMQNESIAATEPTTEKQEINEENVDLIIADEAKTKYVKELSIKEPLVNSEPEPLATALYPVIFQTVKPKVNDQTAEKEFKSSIKINPNINALTMSPNQASPDGHLKTNIRMFENKHHSIETNYDAIENETKKRVDLFKSKNLHGHSSDSQIKQLLFQPSASIKRIIQTNGKEQEEEEIEENQVDLDIKNQIKNFTKFTAKDNRIESIDFNAIIQPYTTDFNFDFDRVLDNLLTKPLLNESNEMSQNIQRSQDVQVESESKSIQMFGYNYINIEEILSRILFQPIQIQNELVNKCLVNYFLTELKLEEHLTALRMYMLFESSEFAQTFISELCDNIIFTQNRFNNLNENLLNPVIVNEALDRAVASIRNCKYVENFSIRIDQNKEKARQTLANKHMKSVSNFSISYQKQILIFLNCLELKYKLEWPLNLIITDKCMRNYNQLFEFLLQIKLVLTALNSIWNSLKCFGLFNKKCNESKQMKQLKLFSHEMQHYLSALQNYVYNQVIQVAWQELEKKLNNVRNLDDLIKAHESYIEYALSRCFLVKKAEVVLNSIQSIFQNILKFRLHLVSDTFDENEQTGYFEHGAFESMSHTYIEFKGHSIFLYRVLQKLVSKSYEFHVNNLSLTLNYNFYYGNDLSLTKEIQ